MITGGLIGYNRVMFLGSKQEREFKKDARYRMHDA